MTNQLITHRLLIDHRLVMPGCYDRDAILHPSERLILTECCIVMKVQATTTVCIRVARHQK